jgi:CRP-like cAMP-binding protein
VVVKRDNEVLQGDQRIAKVGEPSVFGERAVVDPEIRSATARATQEGLPLLLDHSTLEEHMEGNVNLYQAIWPALTRIFHTP